MRGFGSKLMMLILIVLLIYGVWQISTLRKEVASLRAEVHALKLASAGKPAKASALDEARTHIERAKDLAVKGEFEKARSELQKSLDSLGAAGRDASAPSAKALQSLQKGMHDTAGRIDKLLQRIGGKPKPGQGDKAK